MKIVIAAEEHLATRPNRIAPGDTITITATLYVHDAKIDLIDLTTQGGPPEHVPGESLIETVATSLTIEATQ